LIRINFSNEIVIAMKSFQSGSGWKIAIKVCSNIFNQGLMKKS